VNSRNLSEIRERGDSVSVCLGNVKSAGSSEPETRH